LYSEKTSKFKKSDQFVTKNHDDIFISLYRTLVRKCCWEIFSVYSSLENLPTAFFNGSAIKGYLMRTFGEYINHDYGFFKSCYTTVNEGKNEKSLFGALNRVFDQFNSQKSLNMNFLAAKTSN
jgi:hypothetical protein